MSEHGGSAGGVGGVGDGDDSSDWEEASEEGEADRSEPLSVPGLLGPDLLDITAAAAAADDDLGRSLKVSWLASACVSPGFIRSRNSWMVFGTVECSMGCSPSLQVAFLGTCTP